MTASEFKEELIKTISTFDNIKSCEIKFNHQSFMIETINGIHLNINNNSIIDIRNNFIDTSDLNSKFIEADVKVSQIISIYQDIFNNYSKSRNIYNPSIFMNILQQEGLDYYIYIRGQE